MVIVKTVYVNKLPPKNTVIHLVNAVSSCSPEEIKKPHPKPDLHYFEMFWYTPAFGGFQKNIIRMLYPSYDIAVEQHDIMQKKLFGNSENWIDSYYEAELKTIKKELKISRDNRIKMKRWL